MKNIFAALVVAFLVLHSASEAQSQLRAGFGPHVPNAYNPSFQVTISSIVAGPGESVHFRRELYLSESALGAGYGIQWERTQKVLRPYLYVAPTLSLVGGNGTGLAPGLAGGVGLAAPFFGGDYFVELSWRGHGVMRLDEPAYGALSFGRTF